MTILTEMLKCPSLAESSIEVVERKGRGHPDTICDLLARSWAALWRIVHHRCAWSLNQLATSNLTPKIETTSP
ncbi:MAG: hypothetical protein K2X43_17000 [Hyphomonadaceae bacterium]|nr:hypothetical protein [Hyphomonadaceae bacterium]